MSSYAVGETFSLNGQLIDPAQDEVGQLRYPNCKSTTEVTLILPDQTITIPYQEDWFFNREQTALICSEDINSEYVDLQLWCYAQLGR